MLAVGGAVLGSLQFGYNTGVINAPQKVSALLSLAYQHQLALHTLSHTHPASEVSVVYVNSPSASVSSFLAPNRSEILIIGLKFLGLQNSRSLGPIETWGLNRSP